MLKLLIDGVMKQAVKMGSGGMTYIHRFMRIGSDSREILGFCLTNLKRCNVGITYTRDICYELCH
jgi:hypothetical protein